MRWSMRTATFEVMDCQLTLIRRSILRKKFAHWKLSPSSARVTLISINKAHDVSREKVFKMIKYDWWHYVMTLNVITNTYQLISTINRFLCFPSLWDFSNSEFVMMNHTYILFLLFRLNQQMVLLELDSKGPIFGMNDNPSWLVIGYRLTFTMLVNYHVGNLRSIPLTMLVNYHVGNLPWLTLTLSW